MGAPLTPIAPTISPSTLIGNPPPYAATRLSVGMPAKSDGSPWMKLKKSCVETPNSAVYALFCAISIERIGAPSIRLKALRLPPSSRIATFSVTPSSLAFATASSTIFCASSEEMLCFFTTLAIGLPPSTCMHCALIGRGRSRHRAARSSQCLLLPEDTRRSRRRWPLGSCTRTSRDGVVPALEGNAVLGNGHGEGLRRE